MAKRSVADIANAMNACLTQAAEAIEDISDELLKIRGPLSSGEEGLFHELQRKATLLARDASSIAIGCYGPIQLAKLENERSRMKETED